MSSVGVIDKVGESKKFEWKIPDFLSLSTNKQTFYSSPSFEFNNTSLHLEIYPGGYLFAQPGYLSVYVADETGRPLHVISTLQIKKADGTLIEDKSSDQIIKRNFYYANFYSRSHLEQNKSELVPSGIFTIVCILKHNQDGDQATGKAEMSTADYRRLTELHVLSENLRDLAANKDSCDVVLVVEDKEFKAHKAILIARSSVFAAMFQHDTLEKKTGIIKIPDCDSESFQDFLDYLYRGKLEDVSFQSAFHLYSTSNKYDVQKLKEFCIEYLIRSLSPDNVCDIVKLADQYDETKLLTEAQNFFNENLSDIFLTAEWKSLMKNNFSLADKLLVEYSKSKGSQ